MNVDPNHASGIYGTGVANFSLAGDSITGNGTNNANDDDGVRIDGLTGTGTIGYDHGLGFSGERRQDRQRLDWEPHDERHGQHVLDGGEGISVCSSAQRRRGHHDCDGEHFQPATSRTDWRSSPLRPAQARSRSPPRTTPRRTTPGQGSISAPAAESARRRTSRSRRTPRPDSREAGSTSSTAAAERGLVTSLVTRSATRVRPTRGRSRAGASSSSRRARAR